MTTRLPTALVQWGRTYEKLFGKRPELSQINIPKIPEGISSIRLIIVASEIIEWTHNRALQGTYEQLGKHFLCSSRESDDCGSNLDSTITDSDRYPRYDSYAVWVRNSQEADEEFADQSLNDLKQDNHTGITVLEYQLLAADYFFQTGKYLDQQGVTLISGSRVRHGFVLGGSWRKDRFDFRTCTTGAQFPCLRSRQVWM